MKFDPAVARQAKALQADQFMAVALACLPPTTVLLPYRKSLSGRVWHPWKGEPQKLSAPKPITRKALYIFLHECGHAHLHEKANRKPRYVKEFEAEMYAHEKMREHGIAVPHAMTTRAKAYVLRCIRMHEKHTTRKIIPAIRRWVES